MSWSERRDLSAISIVEGEFVLYLRPWARGGGNKLRGGGSLTTHLGLAWFIIFTQKIGVSGPLELLGWNDYRLIYGIEIFS